MYIYKYIYLYSITFSITSNKSVNECPIFRVHFRKVNALAIYTWVSFSFAFARHSWGRTSGRNLWVVSCMLDYVIFFNSLAQGRFWCDFKNSIFNLVLLIGVWRSLYDNALGWIPQNITDDKSTLVQVMAWCRQSTSHYPSQCWPRSMSPYGVTRPQWVKSLKTMRLERNGHFAVDILKCIFSSMKWLHFDSYGAVGNEILVKMTFPL